MLAWAFSDTYVCIIVFKSVFLRFPYIIHALYTHQMFIYLWSIFPAIDESLVIQRNVDLIEVRQNDI